jgi:hypothetical protein
MREVDVLHEHLADGRLGVQVERAAPLRPVLGVLPLAGLGLQVGVDALFESPGLGAGRRGGAAGRLAGLDGVFPCVNLVACSPGPLPGLREGHIGEASEPHIADLAGDSRAQHPGPSPGIVDFEFQSRDAADSVRTGFHQPAHLKSA